MKIGDRVKVAVEAPLRGRMGTVVGVWPDTPLAIGVRLDGNEGVFHFAEGDLDASPEPKPADCEIMVNPYPETIEDDSGQVLVGHQHRAWEEGHEAGIGEVVEWVEQRAFRYTDSEGFARVRYPFTDDDWQAKLKEWGVESD